MQTPCLSGNRMLLSGQSCGGAHAKLESCAVNNGHKRHCIFPDIRALSSGVVPWLTSAVCTISTREHSARVHFAAVSPATAKMPVTTALYAGHVFEHAPAPLSELRTAVLSPGFVVERVRGPAGLFADPLPRPDAGHHQRAA
jgi:hypothetical protein